MSKPATTATASTAATLAKHYLRLAHNWPNDNLRPVLVRTALLHRRERLLGNTPPPLPKEANAATAVEGKVADADGERGQANALYSLLEGRYSRAYPTSEEILRPRGMPSYYANLAAEMQEAPKRNWWQAKWARWSRMIRFS